MKHTDQIINRRYHNYVFIGEAGSGKSEIALNFACSLLEFHDRPVHFFDMDMTKPLFRSRDLCAEIEAKGIIFHYEEQFMDAPTLVGGVRRFLRDPDCYVVMDIGGDYIGARSIGGFAPLFNQGETMIYYILNAFRPWSYDIDHIDKVLGEILGVSHIQLDKVHMVSNPNMGKDTTVEEIIEGHNRMAEMIAPYKPIDFLCVKEELSPEIEQAMNLPVMPIHLYLTYPWLV